jgi:hypothetical protein
LGDNPHQNQVAKAIAGVIAGGRSGSGSGAACGASGNVSVGDRAHALLGEVNGLTDP